MGQNTVRPKVAGRVQVMTQYMVDKVLDTRYIVLIWLKWWWPVEVVILIAVKNRPSYGTCCG